MEKNIKERLGEFLRNNKNQKNKNSVNPLNLLLLSEMELATKLTDPEVLDNIAILMEKSPKIDAIIINGAVPYVPNKYSKRRGEYMDLLEGNVRDRYGMDAYTLVKGNDGTSNGSEGGIDTLVEAFSLAKYSIRNITKKAEEKNIPIYYVYSDKDYENVNSIINALTKLTEELKRQDGEKDYDSYKEKLMEKIAKMTNIDSSIVNFVTNNESGFAPSEWKNKSKKGIKNRANSIYNGLLRNMLSSNGTGKITILNGLFNNIAINGVKINVMHAVNGRFMGNTFVTPVLNGQKRIINKIDEDKQREDVADIYLRSHEAMLDFTALEHNDKPIWILATPPLQNYKALNKRSNRWNKTVDIKRFDQHFDSGLVMFSIEENGKAFIRHVNYEMIRNNVDVFEKEKEAYKIILIGDAHIGAPSLKGGGNKKTAYELLEGILHDIKYDNIKKEDKYIFFLGDMIHGGEDKSNKSDILENKAYGPSKRIEELINLNENVDYDKIIKNIRENIYGVSVYNIGEQIKESFKWINDVGSLASRVAVLDGNHVQKAANNMSEAGILGGFLEVNGVKVDYPDKLVLRDEKHYIFGYESNSLHSTGYRSTDGGRANVDYIVKTGSSAMLQFAGDEHMLHLNIADKEINGKQGSLVAIKPPSIQERTTFEEKILKKGKSIQGYVALYIPKDRSIGTGYIKVEVIPENAIGLVLDKVGGSKIEKIAKLEFIERILPKISEKKETKIGKKYYDELIRKKEELRNGLGLASRKKVIK